MQPRTDDDDKKERRNIVQGHAQARREELKATKNIYSDLAPFEISRLIIENVYVSVAWAGAGAGAGAAAAGAAAEENGERDEWKRPF